MPDTLYVVRYAGPFGFIKPWTAVRDGETYSQQFLTPSIIEGMRQKLEVSAILRHRLTYAGMSRQIEEIQPRGTGKPDKKPTHKRGMLGEPVNVVEGGILMRVVMVEPVLNLAFPTKGDAEVAVTQHLCLCRNEDVLLPDEVFSKMDAASFDQIDGFELRFGREEQSFLVGYNRYARTEDEREMWGWLEIAGKAVREG